MSTPKRRERWPTRWSYLAALLCALGLTAVIHLTAWAQQTGTFGAIRGVVFVDRNGNASREVDEAGLAGVTVRLYDAQGAEVATALTDAGGAYQFLGLFTPAAYTVEAVAPTGYVNTTPERVALTLGLNQTRSLDFGYQEAAILTGVVFSDRNQNGSQEPDEPGLAGVTVRATAVEGQTGVALRPAQRADEPVVTVTDQDGRYTLVVRPGVYLLEIDAPPGYAPIGGASQLVTARSGEVVEVDVRMASDGRAAYLPSITRSAATH